MKLRRKLAPALAVVALTAALVGCNWRGPTPTEATVTAPTGSFAIATSAVAAGNGFGGGTIYAPTGTSQGTFGAVVVAPGFLMDQSTMSWYGPRLATQGFVVLTINTNSTYDNPARTCHRDARRTRLADVVESGRLSRSTLLASPHLAGRWAAVAPCVPGSSDPRSERSSDWHHGTTSPTSRR